jgi:hypothetical protein
MGSGGSGGGGNSIADIIVKSSRQRRQLSHEQFLAAADIEGIRVSAEEHRENLKAGVKANKKILKTGAKYGLNTVSADNVGGKVSAKYGKKTTGGAKKSGKKGGVKLGRKIAEGMFERANELRNSSNDSTMASGSGKSAGAASSQKAVASPRKAISAGTGKKKKTASEIIAGKVARNAAQVGAPDRTASGAIVAKQGPKRVNGAIPALQRGKLRGAKLNRPY